MTRARAPWRSRALRLVRRGALVALVATWGSAVAFHVLDRAFPLPDPAGWGGARSPVVRGADGTLLHIGLDAAGGRRLAPTAPGRHLVNALVAAEDRRFYAHGGVDGVALLRAAWRDACAGAAVEGASTLTMQLGRLADPRPRDLVGKMVQAFRALQIESRLSKAEILARYLDLAPFGGNLRGAEAAAQAWFGKRAADLGPEEAALLVSVLPAPGRYAPMRDPVRAAARRDRVLDRMHEEGFLTDAEHAAARARPLGVRPTAWPDRAPDAWQRAQSGETTIDPALQAAVEAVAARAGSPDGIAVVVVENATGAVRALVGGPRAEAARLDATSRPRGAGSTLKPFLYALAFDAGLAVSSTPLLDLPWSTADWAPTDFDGVPRGPVPAATALAESLNLPAVRLAGALPAGAFADRLRRLGFAHVRGAADGPAVDLSLGTDDVTPLELCRACAILARGGRAIHATLEAGAAARAAESPAAEGPRVLSEGACALVTEALSDPARARPAGAPRAGVAWKTGTSSRRRDAWAAGWTTRVSVVVWRGRLDGAPDASLVGVRAAVPPMFEVLAAADPDPRPFAASDDLEAVEVCAESGLARGPTCPRGRSDRRPRGAAPLVACDVHLDLEVDGVTGFLLCPRCDAQHVVDPLDVAVYAPVLAAWRASVGLPVPALPPHDPACRAPREPAAMAPTIASPRPGQRLLARDAGAGAVGVRALAGNPRDTLALWLDGASVGRAPSGVSVVVEASAGPHVLAVVDGRGRRAQVAFEVVPAP